MYRHKSIKFERNLQEHFYLTIIFLTAFTPIPSHTL